MILCHGAKIHQRMQRFSRKGCSGVYCLALCGQKPVNMKSRASVIAVLAAFFGLVIGADALAQCQSGELEIVVEIVPDSWPGEISWMLELDGELLAEGGSVGATVCIDASLEDPCLQFTISDSYGDGITGDGGYWLHVDGTEVGTGSNYGYGESVSFLCPPGFTCNDGVQLTADDYGVVSQSASSFWYTFTPPANGMYSLSTCGTGCNTTLWIYDYCNMGNFDDTNEGSIYYDDQEGGCGDEANLTVLLEGGVMYWIRLADLDEGCTSFDWTFDFVGPPTGCMDPEACNFNPLAEVDGGNCTYPGDPDCTGPDLVVLESAIVNSLNVQTMDVNESDCYIIEGCLNGYGTRELIRFTTHIKNIGDVDYYIGPTSSNTDTQQFEWGDCHNHWHYKGYAEYTLFTMEGDPMPIGFKNGFCVMDLECSDGGTAQYGCSNMGISAHCGDIYGAGLSCQWIDVTGVADGQYQLVVRVNWDESPDALGRYETDYENNWAVVCITMDRSSGALVVNVNDDCPTFTDCMGEAFGTAVSDCNGDCNGSALMGDLDANGVQEYADAVGYVEHILGNDIEALPCTDVDQDGNITVSDAAYLAQCQYWNSAHQHPDSSGFHSKCNFPVNHVINPFDSVSFAIGAVNWEQGFLDIHVLNPNNRIVGYEIDMVGMGIASAVSLADPIGYPITPSFMPGGEKVIGLSYEGESLVKNLVWTPLLRLYWSDHMDEICIDAIIDVVNTEYHNTLTFIENGCVTASGVSEAFAAEAPMLYPNPMVASATLRFANPTREEMTFTLTDATGREVMTLRTSGVQMSIDRQDLPSGTYMYALTSASGAKHVGRLGIQ